MKLTVSKSAFHKALSEAIRFIPNKTPLQVLRNAKITTKGRRMKIEANNGETSIRKYIELNSNDTDVSFLVPPYEVNKLLSKLKCDTIDIELNGDCLTIKYPRGSAEYQTIAAKEYPNYDVNLKEPTSIKLPTSILGNCIKKAKCFCGNDDLRPQMKSIYAYVKDGSFGYCATNTRILINDYEPIAGMEGRSISWYIQPEIMDAVVASCKGIETCEVLVSESNVQYRFGDTILQSTQAKGAFPDFNRVIPSNSPLECHVDTCDIIEAIDRASIFCDEITALKFKFADKDLSICVDNLNNQRRANESLVHNGCNGNINISLHPQYIATCIKSVDAPELTMKMTDPNRPIIITQPNRPNLTILQMPMITY